MPAGIELQTNFAQGEVTPALQGFVNLKEYPGALLTQQNFLNDNNGAAIFRQGTEYAADTKQDQQALLVPFVFNKEQAYVLEFTANRLRFYTNNGQVTLGASITGASWAANEITFNLTSDTTLDVGDTFTVSGVSPSTYNGTYTVSATHSSGSQVITTAVANPGSYVSGGTLEFAYTISTPYALGPNSWAQVNDVMYLADGLSPIQQLIRLGGTNWTLGPVTITCGPFQPVNGNASNLMSLSGSTLTATNNTFASTDVGTQIIMFDSTDTYNGSAGMWKWNTITAYTSATQVTVGTWHYVVGGRVTATTFGTSASISAASWANDQITFTVANNNYIAGMQVTVTGVSPSGYNGNWTITSVTGNSVVVTSNSNPGSYVSGGTATNISTYSWALGAWSATSGYPTCLAFYQQRLVAGGALNASAGDPTTFAGSMTGIFTAFTPFDPDGTVNPDNSYTFQISASRADGIKWINADRFLAMGTGAAEYLVKSSGPAITPMDINVEKQTNLGSDGVMPVSLNYRLLLIQRGGLYVHEWVYMWQFGAYIATMLNKMADHIMKPGVTKIDYQLNPTPRAWMVRSDGEVVTATQTAPNTWAFARQIFGGSYNGGNPVCEQVCIIPTSTYDQVWFVVKRTVNNQTVRFVEFLTTPFDGTLADAYQVDAGLTYNGSAVTSVSGLSYLQGQTVQIWCNGVAEAPQVVPSNGTLTIPSSTQVAVGLGYTGTLETLQVSAQELQGRLRYATRAFVRLYQTYGGGVYTDGTYSTYLPFSESASTFYTGSARVLLHHGVDTEQHLIVSQSSPYPMTVLNTSIDFQSGAS